MSTATHTAAGLAGFTAGVLAMWLAHNAERRHRPPRGPSAPMVDLRPPPSDPAPGWATPPYTGVRIIGGGELADQPVVFGSNIGPGAIRVFGGNGNIGPGVILFDQDAER